MNKFVIYTPFSGLGLFGGWRGERWARNRIAVFEKFVIPSLLNQTDRDFIHHISWREEERDSKIVRELGERLSKIPNYKFVFSYSGVWLFDDKYPNDIARERLFRAVKGAAPALMDSIGDCDEVYWLLQPSDDLYDKYTVESVKKAFATQDIQAIGFSKGYMCNYLTLEMKEYNPKTSPPFHAIRFPRKTFFDPGAFMNYLGLKKDTEKYPKGTPLPSHEYLPDCVKTAYFEGRGFVVGTHSENISTHFNHPYGGIKVEGLHDAFGLTEPIHLPISYRKWLMRKLPHRWQRKLRFIFGELIYSKIYSWIRN